MTRRREDWKQGWTAPNPRGPGPGGAAPQAGVLGNRGQTRPRSVNVASLALSELADVLSPD